MKPASLVARQQAGFALAALVMACVLAVFMDSALRRSLEREDAVVMEAQAAALLRSFSSGVLPMPAGSVRQPEKAEWRLLDHGGARLAESPGMAGIPGLAWPAPGLPPEEQDGPQGGTYSVASRAWDRRDHPPGRLLLAMDRTHEDALVRGFRRTLALGVLVLSLSAGLIGRLVARWGLTPLHRIALEAGEIDDRNLDRRLDPGTFPGELQELVATLNGTLERLESAFLRLGRFGAELAHELRTPLQNLRSTLENLALRPGCPPPYGHELGGLLEDCDRMGALIEQILFLARAEGAADLRDMDAAALLEETRAFFEAAAEEAGVQLQAACSAGLTIRGDRLLLLRALHNLVSNALRHTPAGGCIRLAATARSLWVEDTGAGIPPVWLGRLGVPFVRGPGTENTEGLGLGLAMVKRIAAMHGGDLDLQSREGRGTRAEVRLGPAPAGALHG